MNERPKAITADRKSSQIIVEWSDQHKSTYPFELLRLGCPCAECRGGHEKMSSDPDPEIFSKHLEDGPSIHLDDLVGVGNYGIKPIWEDGHDYGIYNWQYFRAMCPCSICRED